MDGDEGGIRLSKRFSDGKAGGGEVDYKTKSGTAWSHSYLNQKPWHPLSYPNQRRKWIAEQTHATRQRRAEEVGREYAQEQEFFRQSALISKKEKEKVELMQAVSFMYVRPPGYNAESAKAAEIADENKREDLSKEPEGPIAEGDSSSMPPKSLPGKEHLGEEKKKPRPKDVFGRPLPTEEEFEILKNAPRLETGVAARVKPFAVEVRNVKCLRCGSYGHQSGDRECPLKDAIMPNEESRLKRDDPLNAILAHTDPSEPLKWELKQKPGISPPRGGFNPDDPNQQIVAEDIFDEYGGFLSTGDIPELLVNFSKKPKKSKKRKHKKRQSVHSESEASSGDGERSSKKKKRKVNRKKQDHAKSSSSDTSEFDKDQGKSRHKSSYSSEDSDGDRVDRSRKTVQKHSCSPKGSEHPRHSSSKHSRQRHSVSSETESSGPDPRGHNGGYRNSNKHSYSSDDSDGDRDTQSRKNREKHYYSAKVSDRSGHKRKHSRKRPYSSEDSGPAGYRRSRKSIDESSYLLDDSNNQRQPKVKGSSHKHSSEAHCDSQKHHRNYGPNRYHGSQKSSYEQFYSSEGSDSDKDDQSRKIKTKHSHTRKGSELPEGDMSKQGGKKHCYSSKYSGADRHHGSEKFRGEHSYSTDNSDHQKHPKLRRSSHKR